MTFKEWLDSKEIPYTFHEKDNEVEVDDRLLVPYSEELSELFPGFEFDVDIIDIELEEGWEDYDDEDDPNFQGPAGN